MSERIPYFNRKIKVNKTDKIKRQEAIIYKIVKQIPSINDIWYVKYKRDSDTYYIGKEDEKIIIVKDISDDEENEKEKGEKKYKNRWNKSISQGLLIKEKKTKKVAAKKIANCSSRNITKKKKKKKRKTKVKDKMFN